VELAVDIISVYVDRTDAASGFASRGGGVSDADSDWLLELEIGDAVASYRL